MSFSVMPAQLNFAEQTHQRWHSTGELSSWSHDVSFSVMTRPVKYLARDLQGAFNQGLAGIFVTDQECQIFQKQKRDAKITVSEIKYLGFCSHIDQMRPTI
jgi:hypothetical protein